MIEHTAQEETTTTTIAETGTQQAAGSNDRVNLADARHQAPSIDLLKAHVALLEKEVILSQQGDLFRLVQHHYYRLQTWHDQHTGWRVQRSSTVIRLIRQTSATTPGYLYERLKEPRDFACLTWILWYAENRQISGRGNDQQFLLSQLAEQIQERSAQLMHNSTAGTDLSCPPDLQSGSPDTINRSLQGINNESPLDFRKPADRYSIQRALHYLEGLGGLQLVDGQTREWVEQASGADVLYEFTDVTRSLVSALNIQLVEEVSTRLREPAAALQPTRLPGINTAPLPRAWRALLLGPALFKFDDPQAFRELLTHADAVANELLETFGWLLDIRRDYACVVRESGSSSGPVKVLTPYATNDQITLLMCTMIRERVSSGAWPAPDMYGCMCVANEDMTELFYAVRERYGENWGNEARNKSSQSLLNDLYRKMRQIGIIRGPDATGTILILPLAARYSATYEKAEQETTNRRRNSKPKPKQTKAAQPASLPGMI
jgi:uncharacterized protein (TIGR02678 family)